jgi:hypothetical protein
VRGRETIGPGGVTATGEGGWRFSGAAGAAGAPDAACAGAGGAGAGPTSVDPIGDARRRGDVGTPAAAADREKPPAQVLCPAPLGAGAADAAGAGGAGAAGPFTTGGGVGG